MKKLIIICLTALIITACGRWPDNIHLSVKDITFNAEADSTIIRTEGTWWWIPGISINDTTFFYTNIDGIDLQGESYILKNDCFIVEKRNNTTIFVKLDANTTGNERFMTITFESGDYFDYVHIRQLTE